MEPVTRHRTQIYLPDGLYQKAKNMARKRNTTLAELIRSALRDLDEMKQSTARKELSGGWDQFIKSAGRVRLPVGMAANHDDDWGLVD